jgi:hypothetical protein
MSDTYQSYSVHPSGTSEPCEGTLRVRRFATGSTTARCSISSSAQLFYLRGSLYSSGYLAEVCHY